ncbi:MAG: arginase family protein, partial [Bacteroidota bacterium]
MQKPNSDEWAPDQFAEESIGHHLGIQRLHQRDLRKLKLGIVGLDVAIAKKTRQALYPLSWTFGELSIADLGNVRNTSPDFITPLLRELQTAGITPILIGGDTNLFRSQYQAFQEVRRQVSVVMIDQHLRLSLEPSKAKNYVLNPAVHAKRKRFYHLSHVGAQQHLVDPALFSLLEAKNYEYVRLGAARENLQELEPLIRDADLVGLDISAIKYYEAPAQAGHHPSGFDLGEATQLCRYAGISDKLQSFGLYGAVADVDETAMHVTAAAYAQLIWYFIDGFAARKGDFPATTSGLVEYVVDLKGYEPLTFWKSPRSGRWWIQAPAGHYHGEER